MGYDCIASTLEHYMAWFTAFFIDLDGSISSLSFHAASRAEVRRRMHTLEGPVVITHIQEEEDTSNGEAAPDVPEL